MSDIVARLREQASGDHARGCEGRTYSCECGYDLSTEGLLEMAADEIERLRKAMHEAFMAMCAHRDSPDEEVFQDAIDALGLAVSPAEGGS